MPNNDALNLLSMLAKGLNKGANVGTGIFKQIQKEGQNILDNPIEGGGGMTAAGPVIGQLLGLIAQSGKGANAVSGGGVAADAGQYANELVMKEREKVIKQTAKAQAQAAVDAGATPDQIITGDFGQGVKGAPIQPARQVTVTDPNAIMTSAGPGVKAPIQPVQVPIVPQEQGNKTLSNLKNIIGRMFAASSDGTAGIVNYEQAKTLRQQREVGMTASDKEAKRIEQFNNLMTTGSKVSAETAKLISNIDSGLQQIDALENAFNQDPNIFKQLATPGNASAQVVQTMADDLSDIIGRLRSQGSVTKDEEKRYKSQIPKFGFIKGRLEAPETVKFKLNKLRSLFNEVKQYSTPNNNLKDRIQSAMAQGYSQEEVMERLSKKGVL